MTEEHSFQQRARSSAWLALVEFAIVAALFVADVHHHIYVSKTPYLFVLGWISLRLRGMRWKDVGFARPSSWGKALLVGLAAGIVMEALELFVTQPLLARWLGKMPDLQTWSAIGRCLSFSCFSSGPLESWVRKSFIAATS